MVEETDVTGNKEPQRVTLVKSDTDKAIEVFSVLAGWAIAYYVLHPEVGDSAKDWMRKRTDKLRHKLSVWQTKQDIQTLPEIDEDE